jgi:RHH-type proline utilization regulon transcriptional repressor/proline dehydrogenase/delta 1-pyrroline-5-carboxylate dehydrogenase
MIMTQPSFSSFYTLPESEAVAWLHASLRWDASQDEAVRVLAAELVRAARSSKRPLGQLESFLQEYSLNSEEGLALMALAEALLRIPDKATAGALIRDKVAAANWLEKISQSKDWAVKAAGVGLFMTSKTLDGMFSKLGEPVVREAMIRAMQMMGKQFVLGRDIEEALKNSRAHTDKGYRMSYDILGEGARTAADAERYFESYKAAIHAVGAAERSNSGQRSGISVKLSALHPRYSIFQRARCVPEMSERLIALAKLAASYDIPMTVDAEESERLDISLEIIASVLHTPELAGWEGYGLAVQAYHKATLPVIDHMAGIAQAAGRRMQMRLVKGAYWDSEIKKAQVQGLEDFPVYTRKCHTDVSYLACAQKMFAAADHLYPMFATHNAHSIAAIMKMADATDAPFEFQRLFGMGQAVHDLILERGAKVSIYAPVGPHEDLLPYLVRRLLENGANSSFVNQLLNPDAPVDQIVASPVDKSESLKDSRHSGVALPKDLFRDEKPLGRINSAGMDLHAPEIQDQLRMAYEGHNKRYAASSIIGGAERASDLVKPIFSPCNLSEEIGSVASADQDVVGTAFESARGGFAIWSALAPAQRAAVLEAAADLLEAQSEEAMSLLVREAGKTWSDALAEVREAVDFLRYYAAQSRAQFMPHTLPGPTGESNTLSLCGRGVFVCISPWNFPLAIFTGQIAAALMAGNAVIAKPAQQTPLIAALMIKILHAAGVEKSALHLIIGEGRVVGGPLVAHPNVAGVAFTGSTATAQTINRTLATKDGPIVPLIAETGGQNVMIADTSALPEQVIDDVILSAFGSAGQRCSALRVLYVPEETADKILTLLKGAMAELRVGHPAYFSSDIGPIIDGPARSILLQHKEALSQRGGRLIFEVPLAQDTKERGFYFAPCAFEIPSIRVLDKEVFGPVLHVVRYKLGDLDRILEDIKSTGYGLTLGVHSRIESFQKRMASQMPVGNIYINRSMIGAVVGSQPFGGMGLSGTGPKAGGPHYLARFATEKVVSINTTAAGGNASLVSAQE